MPRLFDNVQRFHGLSITLFIAAAELINRVWVASVFWKSGLTKIQSWDSTLFLFEYEYSVPLLSPELAALLGTAVELSFPFLLALGLLGRLSAGVLFVFNLTAVLFYPTMNAAGIQAHQLYGVMLLIPLLRGPGLLSVDAAAQWLLARRGLGRGAPAPGLSPGHG